MLNFVMQAAPPAQNPMGSIFLFLPLILIFYFLLFRPQQQRIKKHQAMIDAIVRGDKVITNGGIMGKVTKVDGNELTVEIAEGMRVKVLRSMIADAPKPEVANDVAETKKK